MIVYVTQDDGRKNLSKAHQYGNIVALTARDYPIYTAEESMIEYREKVRRQLRNFNGHTDHILMIGDPVNIGLAFAILKELEFTSVKVLKYDRQNEGYYSVRVQI